MHPRGSNTSRWESCEKDVLKMHNALGMAKHANGGLLA